MNSEMFSGDDEIAGVRRGDREAFSALIGHYQHRLYRYLLHLSRDKSTAEDLFQQTWLRVMEKIGRYDAARRFDIWLFSVARNLAVDHFRSNRVMESLDDADEWGAPKVQRLPAPGQSALAALLDYERSAMLAQGMVELPAIHREVLTLRFEEDLKLEEIAEVVGIPISTVKSRLSRALQSMRQRVESHLEERNA